MSPDAHLRLGSLEVLAALALFAGFAARWRPAPPAPSALDVRLEIAERPPRTVALRLVAGQPAFIGRGSECEVLVRDPEASRTHARLDLEGGIAYLADAGSANGTFLDGKTVAAGGIEVRVGDDIDVGSTRIAVKSLEPAAWT